ncbi:serine protease [Cyclospora cayetanensis]|nr:serine protease [Cyclospora cayetanensis]
MAQRGAEGHTRLQMDSLLPPDTSFRLPDLKFSPWDPEEEVVLLDVANRIYVDDTLEKNPYFSNFAKDLIQQMSGDAKAISFKDPDLAAHEINAFVAEKTRNHITELLSASSLSPLSRMVLVNALYFKAPWLHPFSKNRTSEGIFYAETGPGQTKTQHVRFMRQRLENGFTYLKEEGITAFSLPYVDHRLKLNVYMPDDIRAFEVQLAANPQHLEELAARLGRSSLPEHELVLSFPKFKLTAENNSLDLVELFKGFGVDLMFTRGKADFSGMSGNQELYVSSYVHQADIEVDEEGTEAAAATAMGIMAMSLPLPKTPLPVTVDKPFIFQVWLEEENAFHVLFAGRIGDPRAAQ